jgi:hypothetical protein
MKYTEHDYEKAIEFALNYPSKIERYHYNRYYDIYTMTVIDDGFHWHNVNLQGSFVRSCLKWKGIKQWSRIS